MKVIIPMTGYGSRFIAAGYSVLKPFIEIKGRPIIEWIVKRMYSQEDEFIFICREEHLKKDKKMKSNLLKLAPKTKVIGIDKWKKLGPVYDILRALDEIEDSEPYIVNYCDVYMSWNWNELKENLFKRNCDGAVVCYTGFHPNLIPYNNLDASCMVDENENLIEIREKFSYEQDKTKGIHSAGVYYFRSGALMKKYFQMQMNLEMMVKGEYYVSLAYNRMCEDGLKVWVPLCVDKFCNWGIPEDLEEFLFWIDSLKGFEKE